MTSLLDEADLLSDKEIQPSLATAPAIVVGKPTNEKMAKAWATRRANAAKAGTTPPKKAPAKRVAARGEIDGAPAPRRRPVGELIGDVLEKVAVIAGNFNPPGARALAFASPALGRSLDGIVAGSPIDKRVLQPLTAGTEKWATLASALGLPFMVMAVSMQPELKTVLEPQIRAAMVVCLEEQVKVLKKRRAREKDVTKLLGELANIDDSFKDSKDPIGELLDGFFAGMPEPETVPEPEGEPVGATV